VRKGPSFTFQITREGIEAHLDEMERKLDRLRSLYESYFMGTERMPPNTPRREMNRMMLEMQQVPIGNSSLRFRFQALSQKWVLHMTYWNRTLREIESGTYRRDVARAQRHMAERGGLLTEEQALAIGIPKSRVKAFVASQQRQSFRKTGEIPDVADAANQGQDDVQPLGPAQEAPPAAAAAAAARPAPTAAKTGPAAPPPIPASARRPTQAPSPASPSTHLPGLAESDFEDAYSRYMEAHRKLGPDIQPITKDKMRQRLGKQLPRILEEQRCARVRLEIAVEQGKVRLRAWPAESGQ
jgi:hypothetical protein